MFGLMTVDTNGSVDYNAPAKKKLKGAIVVGLIFLVVSFVVPVSKSDSQRFFYSGIVMIAYGIICLVVFSVIGSATKVHAAAGNRIYLGISFLCGAAALQFLTMSLWERLLGDATWWFFWLQYFIGFLLTISGIIKYVRIKQDEADAVAGWKARQQAQQQAQLMAQQQADWRNAFVAAANKILNALSAVHLKTVNDPVDLLEHLGKIRVNREDLDAFHNMLEEGRKRDPEFTQTVSMQYARTIEKQLAEDLTGWGSFYTMIFDMEAVHCLSVVKNIKTVLDAKEAITVFIGIVMKLEEYIPSDMLVRFDSYGKVSFPFDHPEAEQKLQSLFNSDPDTVVNNIASYYGEGCSTANAVLESEDRPDQSRVCEAILEIYHPLMIYSNVLMWYTAWKKPFVAANFLYMSEMYRSYTGYLRYIPSKNGSGELKISGNAEEMLARIYSRKQVGGKGTVDQEKAKLKEWTEAYSKGYSTWMQKEYIKLASGLCWMEEYDLELYVLREMVRYDFLLPEELQQRLSFLETGGATGVKLYEVGEAEEFQFDSSSVSWKETDITGAFRRLEMRGTVLNYSLALDNWKKSLPLAVGQRADMDLIYPEFSRMIPDFDGEVTCRRGEAHAVNMLNMKYPDVAIFHFTSERCRCASILFQCEKFGRNLNVNIWTLFSPEANLSFEEQMKYCLAIKENLYIQSFRESILQAVDRALRSAETGKPEMQAEKMNTMSIYD